MEMILLAILFLIRIFTCNADDKCCPEKNEFILEYGWCLGNHYVDFKCGGVYVSLGSNNLTEAGMTFLNNGTLLNQEGLELAYCRTTIIGPNNTTNPDSFIICYIPDKSLVSEENTIRVVAILGYCSLIFIILTIIVYASIPKLLDLQGICIMHCLVGMALGIIFLGIIQLAELSYTSCESFALITYFAFIYMFFWLSTLSFHIWRTTVNPEFSLRTKKWPLIYHIFASSGTLSLLIIVLLSHYTDWSMWNSIKPGIGLTRCWFETINETFIYFYGPISILLICNIVFYIWTVAALSHRIESTNRRIIKYRLKICIRLSIIMGITWIFEIITALLKNRVQFVGKILIFILDILNTLQGFLIFLVLVVFRKRVRRALANKNPFNITFPRSWKNLEDEELTSEDKAQDAIIQYRSNEVHDIRSIED